MTPDNFVMGCGCGCTIIVRNAGFVATDRPPCEHCQPVLDGTDDQIIRTEMVSRHLGWCGCGNPEDIDLAMLAYLDSGTPDILALPEGLAELMLAYIADDLGWTEHGGSVYGAWLTDDGREALTNLKANTTTEESQ